MQHPELQLMLYGKDIAQLQPQVQYDGVTLSGVTRTNNPNYLFVNLTLADTVKPGDIALHFRHNGGFANWGIVNLNHIYLHPAITAQTAGALSGAAG